jgi:hypothetical protein
MGVFALALSTIKILDAKFKQAELDAYLELLNHKDNRQKFYMKLLLNKYNHLF